MSIQNIIFDLGNVLIEYDFDLFYQKIGYEKGERHLDEAAESIILFESGKISAAEFLSQMQKIYNFSMTLEDFKKHWAEVFWENKTMINLARSINQKYPTFLFSNTDEIHFPYIWQKFSSLHFFQDRLMLSYELGEVKPDLDSYKKALEKFGLNAKNTVFIDDRPKNIEAAKKFGMQGIVHKDFNSTKEQLEKILNK